MILNRILYVMIAAIFFGMVPLAAQESSDNVELKKLRLSLSYENINNTGPRLNLTAKTKVDKIYEKVPGLKVDFFYGDSSTGKPLGYTQTDKNGEALFVVPETLRKVIDTSHTFLYTASVVDQENFKDAEADIEILRSQILLEAVVEDSVKMIRLQIMGVDSSGQLIPQEDLEPIIYVQRMFGLLQISEEFEVTDEEGIMTMEFPDNIKGGENGVVKIVTKLDEHDEFGTLSATKVVNWGEALQESSDQSERELWSSGANSPLYLVFIVDGLMILIWGVIAYLIYNIYLINKLGKDLTNKQSKTL